MAVVNGTNLIITLGGTAIANAQEVSLTLNHDVETFSASGILTSLEISGGTEDAPTYSASFELTGAITKAAT